MNELNKKLAEWAGYSVREEYAGGFHLFKTPQKPSPDGIHYDEKEFEENWYSGFHTDYFTESLDACFEWLVPKLYAYVLQSFNEKHKNHHAAVVLEDADLKHMRTYSATVSRNENPALALCLAIEKLIDSRENEDKS